MTNNVVEFIVRNNGSIDKAATLAKFTAALALYSTQRETEDGDVARAVNAVFDRHPGANINMPALEGFSNQELGTPSTAFKVMSERIRLYVRANSGENGLFEIRKGKGGGVSRRADKPATTEQK